MHFFDKRHHRGLLWYLNQMPDLRPGQMAFEKTPIYFTTPAASVGLRRLNASMRILIAVRDPAKRTISDYTEDMSLSERRADLAAKWKGTTSDFKFPDMVRCLFTKDLEVRIPRVTYYVNSSFSGAMSKKITVNRF